ncbi:MAG: hypothetical protein IK015_10320 [Treponema sp.]|nr:hypothetical protein [Treponema sp.]
MKKLTFILIALSIIFAACSNSAGGSEDKNTEFVTFDQDQYWKAESTSQGIKVTFFALPEHYRNFYVELANETIGISSFPQNWTDRSKDWTGIFPLVEAGKNYTFRFHVSENQDILPTKKFNMRAVGGAQTTISSGNTTNKATLSWSEQKEILLLKIQNSNLPSASIPVKNTVKFFAGTGNPNWNAELICEYNYDPTQYVFEYNLSTSSEYYTIQSGIYNSDKNTLFSQCCSRFKLADCSDFEFVKFYESNSVSFGKEESKTSDEDQYWKAESTPQGVKFTIFALPEGFRDKSPFIVCENDGLRAIPKNWTDKSTNWTGVFPLVTSNKCYRFRFHLDGISAKKLKMKASGGIGHLVYSVAGWSPILSFDDEKISIKLNKFSMPVSIQSPKTGISFWVGNNTGEWPNWDGTYITDYNSNNAEYDVNLLTSCDTYKAIKSKLTSLSRKQFFAQYNLSFNLSEDSDFSYSIERDSNVANIE